MPSLNDRLSSSAGILWQYKIMLFSVQSHFSDEYSYEFLINNEII